MDSYQGSNEEPLSLHKYFYGADNPANMVDPSGNVPIVSNWYWGNAVHDKIAENFRFASASFSRREADIPISQILGVPWAVYSTASRPDLVQYPAGQLSGQVYEIKPEGSWMQGSAQLCWYLGLLNGLDPQKRSWGIGSVSNYIPPPIITLKTGVFAIVSPPVNGVILYHVEDFRLTVAVLGTYLVADMMALLSIATLTEVMAE